MNKKEKNENTAGALLKIIEICSQQAKAVIEAEMSEPYLPSEYKEEYKRKLRRVGKKIEDLKDDIVKWRDAINDVDLEYFIRLNAIYQMMVSEFECFDGRPAIINELEKAVNIAKKAKPVKATDCVYTKTMMDYIRSIDLTAERFRNLKVISRARARKYGTFDAYAFNVESRELFNKEMVDNELYNSYKFDSLTHKRSFSYIKTLVQIACAYATGEEEQDYECDLYIATYTTPSAMVSFKVNLGTMDIYAEIRFYDRTEKLGYEETRYPLYAKSEMYKLFENFGFSDRQRRDANLKYRRIVEIIDSMEEDNE